MTKRALLVGINAYPSSPLRGCVNDVSMMNEVLTQHYGFTAEEKRILTDAAATTQNIISGLDWLVAGAVPGDVLVFHYSGHGSQMANTDGDFETDGLDEILCPVDLNWRDKVIKDDDLKRIFDKVPAGVNLTIVLDSCHSGSAVDQEVEYMSLGEATKEIVNETSRGVEFGESPNCLRYLPPPAYVVKLAEGLQLDVKSRSIQSRDVDQTGMMISGCQSTQTSADAYIDGQYSGAATYALTSVLKKFNYDITYKQLVDEMNQFMVSRGYTQRPELSGSAFLRGENFILPKT